MDKPLCPLGNRFLWVFCLGSGPVFLLFLVLCCLLRCFRWRNASLAGGFAGRRVLVAFCGFCVLYYSICLLKMDMLCPCTNVFPTAYAHVRTEPLARHRPHSKEKKIELAMIASSTALMQACKRGVPSAVQSVVFGAVG